MRDARDSVSQSDPLKVYTCAKGLTKVRVLGHCPFSVVFSSMGDVKDVRDFAMNSNLSRNTGLLKDVYVKQQIWNTRRYGRL